MDTLTFIGTATCLLEVDGVRLLTDPAFYHGDDRIHLGWGLFSRRLVPPVVDVIDVVDVILLTHTHLDHFDQPAVDFLGKDLPIITNVGAASKLRSKGFGDVTGLRVGEEIEFGGIRLRGLPAHHGPFFMRPFTGSVIGFGLECSHGRLWISGDTVGTADLKVSLSEFDPHVGIVFFGGVRFLFRLTFDGIDALETLRHASSLSFVHEVHVDDWSHFRTGRADISRVFEGSDVCLVFPPRGKTIGLWFSGEQV